MKTVVVLSVPRSGSSLLAGILHRLGVYMGNKKDLEKGKGINKYGCYENQEVLSLTYYFLALADSLYYPVVKPNYNKIKKVSKEFVSNFNKIIQKNKKPVWGWKVPLSLYFMPYIHKKLKNPYYIFLKRDINKTIDSHINVSGFKSVLLTIKNCLSFFNIKLLAKLGLGWLKIFLKKGNTLKKKRIVKKVILDANKQINVFIKNKKKLSLTLKELINNSEKVINKLIKFLKINPSKKQIKEALNFIHPELVHY